MIEYKDLETLKQEVAKVTCDRCGRDCLSDVSEAQECWHIDDVGGYGSVFGDGTRFQLDLCQHCLDEVLGEFIRTPNVTCDLRGTYALGMKIVRFTA